MILEKKNISRTKQVNKNSVEQYELGLIFLQK